MIHNVANTAGKDKVIQYVRTAQNLKFKVIAPDINLSHGNFTINNDSQIVAGLTLINHVGDKAVTHIVNNRNEYGLFTSIEDFLSRKIEWRNVNVGILEALVHAGAFDSIAPNRKLTWAKIQIAKKKATIEQFETIEIGTDENDNSIKEIYVEDYSVDEKDNFEREALGFQIENYMTKNKDKIQKYRSILRTIAVQKNKNETIGMVDSIKVQTQKNGEKYARITVTNIEGIKESWLIFASIWNVYKTSVKVFGTFFALGRKDDRNFLVDSLQPLSEIINLND